MIRNMNSLPSDTDESASLLRRLRESVTRLRGEPQRVVQAVEENTDKTRTAIRQLARSRVALTLRQLRATQGFSYEQVQFQTGLSQQLLFDVEYKEHRLTLEELRKLAACYGVSVGDILGIDLD